MAYNASQAACFAGYLVTARQRIVALATAGDQAAGMTTENPYHPPGTDEPQNGKPTWQLGCGLLVLTYFVFTLFLIPLIRFVWRVSSFSGD